MRYTTSLLFCVADAVLASKEDGKCRILSLKGGGIHGAWEAGCVQAVMEHMEAADVKYDLIGGVSIGAINASIFALHPPGEERAAAQQLADLYGKYKTSDLFEFYQPTVLAPFLHSSMADNTNFYKIIEEMLKGKPFQRKLSLIAADMNSGQPIILDETLSDEERVQFIIASASIPFVFPPQLVGDLALIDGGTFSNVAIGDPIERCREDGYADEDIIVDLLLCYEKPWLMNDWANDESLIWKNAYHFYERRKEITHYYAYTEEVQRLFRGYHRVNFRLVIQPSVPLSSAGFAPINATLEDLEREKAQGYLDG